MQNFELYAAEAEVHSYISSLPRPPVYWSIVSFAFITLKT